MNISGFKRYLKEVIYKGKRLTSNGINARISWCKRVERDFKINLDEIAKSSKKINKLREEIYSNNLYKPRQRSNFPNGLSHYYIYRSGKRLPRLK